MTQLYEAAIQKVSGAAAGHLATLLTSSSARPDLRELGVFVSSAPATGPTIGLGRGTGTTSGATTGQLGIATDFNDLASTCTLVGSWATTQPSVPAGYMRRISLPNAIGAGVIWTWEPQAFNIPPSSFLTLWQISAVATTFDIYARWEE